MRSGALNVGLVKTDNYLRHLFIMSSCLDMKLWRTISDCAIWYL